jgi:energy-converting hydrogenase Eha subunit C
LLQRFFEICLLRAGPQDLPASRFLLWISLLAYGAVGMVMSVQNLDVARASLLVLLDTALLAALLFALLWSRGLLERYLQTMTALLGTGAILQVAALPILSWQREGLGEETISTTLMIASLLLWIWLLWNLIVVGHILRHTLSTRLPIGVLLGLAYLFISYSVTRILFFPETN